MKSGRYNSRRDKWEIQENSVAGDDKELHGREKVQSNLALIFKQAISTRFLAFHTT